jgi:hypothetical protein
VIGPILFFINTHCWAVQRAGLCRRVVAQGCKSTGRSTRRVVAQGCETMHKHQLGPVYIQYGPYDQIMVKMPIPRQAGKCIVGRNGKNIEALQSIGGPYTTVYLDGCRQLLSYDCPIEQLFIFTRNIESVIHVLKKASYFCDVSINTGNLHQSIAKKLKL